MNPLIVHIIIDIFVLIIFSICILLFLDFPRFLSEEFIKMVIYGGFAIFVRDLLRDIKRFIVDVYTKDI